MKQPAGQAQPQVGRNLLSKIYRNFHFCVEAPWPIGRQTCFLKRFCAAHKPPQGVCPGGVPGPYILLIRRDRMQDSILVTGGAGFIGSNFVLSWIETEKTPVINLDLLSYAGNPENLSTLKGDDRHQLVRGDIGDRAFVASLLETHQPRAIVHFAAESHVDRSIASPEAFIHTNVLGTFTLLDQAKTYWVGLNEADKGAFRFLHVSTDEVYGTLGPDDPAFSETTPYAPNSPYAASKAASDHLVRAYHHTWGFPSLTTNCSNNYGPFQFPEKLIPLMILNALDGKPLPVYGDGMNVRDWLF